MISFSGEEKQKLTAKKSCRKTLWHWVIEDKMADDVQTRQMESNELGEKTVLTLCNWWLILNQLLPKPKEILG